METTLVRLPLHTLGTPLSIVLYSIPQHHDCELSATVPVTYASCHMQKVLVVAHRMHAALRDAENAYDSAATESKALKSSAPLLACSKTLTESRDQRWVALKRQLHSLQERQEVYLTGNGGC